MNSKKEELNNGKDLSVGNIDFVIILTVEGTEYEEVEIIINNPNKPIRQFVWDIVKTLNLPHTDAGGNPIVYLLGTNDGNEECEILDFEDDNGIEQSLLDYNIHTGCHLYLIKVPTAGGGYDEEYAGKTFVPYLSEKKLDRTEQHQKLHTSYCPICRGFFKNGEEECPNCGEPLREFPLHQDCYRQPHNCFLVLLKLPITIPYLLFKIILEGAKNVKLHIRHKKTADIVFSSVFAPAEIAKMSHMLVQVFLHLFEETENVKALAQESDRNAERRYYAPLEYKLKKGDKVNVRLNIYGETLLMTEKKSVVWQGSFTKCSFDFFVPKDIDAKELSCVALLSVNGVPVGEMRFITKIVEVPRKLNPEIISHKYNKVFISYSHQDESKVKFLHEGLELGAVPHFFDRKYLKAGDVFPQVIQDYINSADLFILCWSENALKSEYVQKERSQALERAFPQVQPEQAAKLRIYPMSIEPRAELPSDMKEYYHFGEI